MMAERKLVAEGGDASSVAPQPTAKRKSDHGDSLRPAKKAFSINLKSKATDEQPVIMSSKPSKPIKMSLSATKPKEMAVKKTSKVSSVFNQDDDSEEEEMPAEARMRMRNIGRETPTAAGPNSFGKDKLGFCDRQRLVQKQLQAEIDKIQDKEKV